MATEEEKEESEEEEEQETGKKFGKGANQCRRCGRQQGLVRRYDIYLCRQCFREMAPTMGFEKYR